MKKPRKIDTIIILSLCIIQMLRSRFKLYVHNHARFYVYYDSCTTQLERRRVSSTLAT